MTTVHYGSSHLTPLPPPKMAMGKALDFADASEEVVDLLCESMLVDATPINVKIARLYLLSDILHNSSAPVRNASSYRMHIQKSLPKIFEHLVSEQRKRERERIHVPVAGIRAW